MKNLLSISLSLLSLAACVSTRDIPSGGGNRFLDRGKTSRYQLLIKTGTAETGGILILKYADGEWRGSLVNEFGVKAFDLVAPKGKCRLKNVVPFLDKWYIRRTIASDFAFLFWEAGRGKADGGKSIERLPDGTLLLRNGKRRIEYLFQPVEE
jgi:hypothetical protein